MKRIEVAVTATEKAHVVGWLVSSKDGSQSNRVEFGTTSPTKPTFHAIPVLVFDVASGKEWTEFFDVSTLGKQPWLLCLDLWGEKHRLGSATLPFEVTETQVHHGRFLDMNVADSVDDAWVEFDHDKKHTLHIQDSVDVYHVPSFGEVTLSLVPKGRTLGGSHAIFYSCPDTELLEVWPYSMPTRTCPRVPRMCALLSWFPYSTTPLHIPTSDPIQIYRSAVTTSNDITCLALGTDVTGNEVETVLVVPRKIWQGQPSNESIRVLGHIITHVRLLCASFPTQDDPSVYEYRNGPIPLHLIQHEPRIRTHCLYAQTLTGRLAKKNPEHVYCKIAYCGL